MLNRAIVAPANGVQRGGYILWESGVSPQIIIIASGSEVHIALEAGKLLQGKGKVVRVVSLPSWDIFDSQPLEYRNDVIPPDIKMRVSVEAGTPIGWERYVGPAGIAIGVPHFGVSAPGEIVYKQFGLTTEHIVDVIAKLS